MRAAAVDVVSVQPRVECHCAHIRNRTQINKLGQFILRDINEKKERERQIERNEKKERREREIEGKRDMGER